MQLDLLKPTKALHVFRYADMDEYRLRFTTLEADFMPLSFTDFGPIQAIVQLPECEVVVIRSFPRLIDATMTEGKMMVLIPMEKAESTTINGYEVSSPSLAVVHGKTGYKCVEREAKVSAAVQLHPSQQDRGWPIVENAYVRFDLSAEVLQRLQRLIWQVIAFASQETVAWDSHGLGQSIQSSILACLDHAMETATGDVLERSAAYRRQFSIARRIDEVLAASPAAPIYSEALAREIGVSVRTLHNATMRMRGASLHQYLRLRRLWLTRKRLLSGDPALKVKTCAMSFGFWHLGEFSSFYSAAFGELPSQTLARARGR